MRVLVVDDEPAVRQALERALRFEGFPKVEAYEGLILGYYDSCAHSPLPLSLLPAVARLRPLALLVTPKTSWYWSAATKCSKGAN